MLILFLIPQIPFNRPPMPYWRRVNLLIYGDFLNNMVIFWCAFFLFRGIDYYQKYRKHEQTAARLEVQLANTQLSALRMQLNPHFLFNAMNSISSLMRIDIDAADRMLEQLSCLMRITLERGDAQFIPLRDEMEFIETYLAMQAQRYAGRVEQTLSVDPELYDALVPSMLLQPIVENAFVHGLSKINANGELSVAVRREGTNMQVSVVNSGTGLKEQQAVPSDGHGVGLVNIKDRLRLHYGETFSLSIVELDARRVQVTVQLPLQFFVPD
jgi:two-component system, LytTR family, sensor kinase